MTTFEAIVLAIVEGITEYLPVSSTGHMILTEAFLKMKSSEFNRMYIINIQFGAILAVLFLYWKRFLNSLDFYLKLFVAFLPAAVLGFLLNDYIDKLLESVITVAISLIAGGIVLLFSDRWFQHLISVKEVIKKPSKFESDFINVEDPPNLEDRIIKLVHKREPISYKQSLIIGIWQSLAMIPGISRSAASILGGLLQRLHIQDAAEFSFFLAVPTISAAAGYKTLKGINYITAQDMEILLIGNLVSFLVAVLAIKFFISVITKYGLRMFGLYRIILGSLILLLMLLGYDLKIS